MMMTTTPTMIMDEAATLTPVTITKIMMITKLIMNIIITSITHHLVKEYTGNSDKMNKHQPSTSAAEC
jgi:hypothetical protein